MNKTGLPLFILFLFIAGIIPFKVHAAGVYYTPSCVVAQKAGALLDMYSLVGNCSGAVQNDLVQAVKSISNGNGGTAAALGGMLSVESSCGLAPGQESATCSGCRGCYNLQSSASSASGATQFLDATYKGVVARGSSTSNAMIKELGGCGTTVDKPTTGSLLDPKRTPSNIRSQYSAFLTALCNDTAKNNKDYYTSMPAASVLLGYAYDTSVNKNYLSNSTVQNNISATGANAPAVSQYINHNLGPGDAKDMFNALSSNPNANVSSFLSPAVINGNKALYCQNSRGPCTPVSAAQAVRNMNSTMFGKPCSKKFLADIGVSGSSIAPLPGSNIGTCGVDLTCGDNGAAALAEILAKGGVAGDYVGTTCMQTGINCFDAQSTDAP